MCVFFTPLYKLNHFWGFLFPSPPPRLIYHIFYFSRVFFFFPLATPSLPAYLDDEEDEDPFGDYVISKSLLTKQLSLLARVCSCLVCCRARMCVIYCPVVFFMKEAVAHNVINPNWAPAERLQHYPLAISSFSEYDFTYRWNRQTIHISMIEI